MFNPEAHEPDPLKLEHLAEGIRPITACVGTTKEYIEEIATLKDIENVGHHSDYNESPRILNEHGFKADDINRGFPTYVISPIDGKPKFTKGLFDCTSLVVVGRENGTEKELSFLTHQDPKHILSKQKDKFETDLKKTLNDFKERCLLGSIDVVIAGGKLLDNRPGNYEGSLEILSSVVQETFGFEPLAICGPKEPQSGTDDVYFDTKNRRLFIIRPSGSNFPFGGDGKPHNDVFKPSQVNDKMKEWGKK